MKIEVIPCLDDNYSYLIYEKETNTVSIVDPSEFAPCEKIIKNYKKLDNILITHHHADHVGGNLKLKEKYNSKIFGYQKDRSRIPGIDILLYEDQIFNVGNLEVKVIFIPGHTSGHIAYYIQKENVVFTGDTLFSLGCGRVFEGSHKQMFESLNKLKILDPKTKVYCGHEYTKKNLEFCLTFDTENSFLREREHDINAKIKKNQPTIPTSLEEELKTNIFLRCDNIKVKQALNQKDSSDQEIFTKLRDLKDAF